MRVGRLDTMARLLPVYGVPEGEGSIDRAALFGRTAPLVLEIGSGMGETTVAMASMDPDRDYLAVEVHTAGVANLLGLVEAAGLANIRVVHGDAVALARDRLGPGGLAAIHVFFPDPWPKARHHKRRLIQPGHVRLLADRLEVDGVLHCATDAHEYAEQMLEVLTAEPRLMNVHNGFVPRPAHRPGTRYEQRGLLAGRQSYDLRLPAHRVSLADELDRLHQPGPDAVYEAFAAWSAKRGLPLYPHQEEALIELVSGANVILSTPTGSGKSLVATGAHFAALTAGHRTFYTAPIKALVSEKFFALCDIFGPADVGMLTGDASVNADAPIICCTAEILANIALRDGAGADVGQVVMDEFHFYADPERGWAWQVPLIELPQAQFLLMSATLGDVSRFVDDLTRRTGRPTAAVTSAERPVPLMFTYAMTPLHETIEELLSTRQAPVYIVHFTQAAALERAQALTSVNLATRAEKDLIAETIGNFRFTAGFGKTLSRLVRHGIGVHHAGMLPKYRRLVETLAQAGLLKVICGTDTLGVGINVPIRTVLFTGLSKFDGSKMRLLQAREFHQIAGRAGRAGFDTLGTVVVQAPEHVIDNERALAKAGDDERKRRKVVRKKPPEGSIGWGRPTFERLVAAEPEPLKSSFVVSHSMLLNVISRPGDGFAAMRHLLTDNDEDRASQRRLIRRAIAIYRALLAGGVVERLATPDAEGRSVRLTVDLQWDFALNQPLSPLALAAIELLDRDSPVYALDVLSVIESTLDDPRQVLSAQQFKARGEAVAADEGGRRRVRAAPAAAR